MLLFARVPPPSLRGRLRHEAPQWIVSRSPLSSDGDAHRSGRGPPPHNGARYCRGILPLLPVGSTALSRGDGGWHHPDDGRPALLGHCRGRGGRGAGARKYRRISLNPVPKYRAISVSGARPTKRGAIAKSPPGTHRRGPRTVRPHPPPRAGGPHPSSTERAACAGTCAHTRARPSPHGEEGVPPAPSMRFSSAKGTGCVADNCPYTSTPCARPPLAVPSWDVVCA